MMINVENKKCKHLFFFPTQVLLASEEELLTRERDENGTQIFNDIFPHTGSVV